MGSLNFLHKFARDFHTQLHKFARDFHTQLKASLHALTVNHGTPNKANAELIPWHEFSAHGTPTGRTTSVRIHGTRNNAGSFELFEAPLLFSKSNNG
jgi:hypothetical protein